MMPFILLWSNSHNPRMIFTHSKWQVIFFILCLYGMDVVYCNVRYSIPEEMPEGSFVGNIAKDLGIEISRLISGKARVVTKSGRQYVDLSRDKGTLVVKERIDREELCKQTTPCSFSFDLIVENPIQLHRVTVEQKPPNTDWRFPPNQRPGPSGQHRFHTLQQRWTPYEKSRAGARPEEAGAGAGVIAGTGPWPNPPTEAEQLQAMMAAANASEATATLGPRYNLQYGPDYRQNVYIPGSTATLTANPQQQVLQQALPPPQALPPTEVPKAAQTPASKKKPTKKDKK
nr:protocadherin cluster 1 gamma 5a [Danio rerio]